MNDILIKFAENGFIVKVGDEVEVFEVGDSDGAGTKQRMMIYLLDIIGNGSRYSENRVVVSIAHGDKYEDIANAD